jgi:hypothetical protein
MTASRRLQLAAETSGGGLVAGLDIDDASGQQPSPGKGRSKEILPCDASPPSGSTLSIAGRPKGSVARLRAGPPSRRAIRSRSAIGIAIRRWRRQTEATDFGQPTATVTAGGSPRFPPAPCRSPASAALAGSLGRNKICSKSYANEISQCIQRSRMDVKIRDFAAK